MQTYQIFINGEWVDSSSGDYFESIDPYSQKPWALIPDCNSKDVEKAVAAAKVAYEGDEWKSLNATSRGKIVKKFGQSILKNAKYLAEIEVKDNGKLYAEVYNQCVYMSEWFEYFGGLADKI